MFVKMNILHIVEIYSPDIGGMAEVVRRISEEIVGLGHHVCVATSHSEDRKSKKINGVEIFSFKISGRLANGIHGSDEEIDRFHTLIDKGNFDIVTLFAAQHWATDLCLTRLKDIRAKKIFVPTGFSGLYNPLFRKYYLDMRKWIHNFDQVVFLSNDYRDINFARENQCSKFRIIPNGASEKEFLSASAADFRSTHSLPPNRRILLFVGSHYPDKGHLETIKIFKRLKSHNITLVIAANLPNNMVPKPGFNIKRFVKHMLKKMLALFMIKFKRRLFCPHQCLKIEEMYNTSREAIENDKSIIVRDFDRKQVVDLYKQSDLFIFPSRIECSPLVIFEAMAGRLPFLATDVGNVSEIISWTGGGLLLPTIKRRDGTSDVRISEAVSLIDAVVKDSPLREDLKSKGHTAWQKRFTWEIISRQYEQMYKELAHGINRLP